jgi:hypothetical protein
MPRSHKCESPIALRTLPHDVGICGHFPRLQHDNVRNYYYYFGERMRERDFNPQILNHAVLVLSQEHGWKHGLALHLGLYFAKMQDASEGSGFCA